ncbi:MAG TPA: hypothetical protein VEX17_02785 [Bacillales bacterium]|nr:hypothetical protein [Bacillales bacterium]
MPYLVLYSICLCIRYNHTGITGSLDFNDAIALDLSNSTRWSDPIALSISNSTRSSDRPE